MADLREGVAARLNFAKGGRESSWRRKKVPLGPDGSTWPVASVLQSLAAREGFEVDGAAHGDLVELRGPALGVAVNEVQALTLSAAESGAHVELAVFPLEGDFTCHVWNARRNKWVELPPDAREVQGDFRFFQRKLREAQAAKKQGPDRELERRKGLLQEACGWPGRYPVAGVSKDLGYWLRAIRDSAGADARPVLERFGREQAELAARLVREVESSDMKWRAAAQAVGLSPDDLHYFSAGLSVPLVLASPAWKKKLGLKGMELSPVTAAFGRIAPELLSAKERKELLEDARHRAQRSERDIGAWLEASRRLGGRPAEELLREALALGAREDAAGKYPGFAGLAQQVFDWSFAPDRVIALHPLPPEEGGSALEAVVRAGLPTALQRRIEAAREAVPPYGLKPLVAWALTPKRATKPALECEACGAKLKPKAELAIPPLSEKHGARTVRVYECDACAEEEPLEEYVRLTVEEGVPRGAPKPKRFEDYPDLSDAERMKPPGFVRERYRDFLKEKGLEQECAAQLEGHLHGFDEEELIGVSCRHKATPLQLSAHALGLKLPQTHVLAEVCLKAGCKRPGISDEVAAA